MKLWVTTGAAVYTVVAGLLARTVHVPVLSRVIVDPLVPLAVQRAGVVVVNVTGKPDDVVAFTVTGDCASVLAASAGNVIVCAAFEMVKACGTAVAAA